MRPTYVAPSLDQAAFNCPHCAAYTTQSWHYVSLEPLKQNCTPSRNIEREISRKIVKISDEEALRAVIKEIKDGAISHVPVIHYLDGNKYLSTHVSGLSVAKCFNCRRPSVWAYETMIYPVNKDGDIPNQDLPDEIRADMEEARSILNLSPRGAAALLRLALEKLVNHLSGKKDNINANIALLVSKGLDPEIQQSLDLVRVIGNDAVHPGLIDLRDDRGTAQMLYQTVNIVAERLITIPNKIKNTYRNLPPSKLAQIESRNKAAKQES